MKIKIEGGNIIYTPEITLDGFTLGIFTEKNKEIIDIIAYDDDGSIGMDAEMLLHVVGELR